MKVAFSPIYVHPLPPRHRFPMEKYRLLPQQLRYEGIVESTDFFEPQPAAEVDILRAHSVDYWRKLQTLSLTRKEERATGFPLSQTLIEREIVILQGSIQSAHFALRDGIAFNIAGGTHHAFADRGEGFCLLNDIAVAALHLLENNLAQKILVVDLDVHQGNGTAKIFENDRRVFTFSMHGAKNYPLRKEHSDLDVGLPDGTNDAAYLAELDQHLPRLLQTVEPDFIFYQSGVDVLATDKLGRLALSPEGCRRRDERVFRLSKRDGIPVAVSMGGGYSERLADIINAHAATFRTAASIY